MMIQKNYNFWFVTGSQHLYGDDTLKEVNRHSEIIASWLDQNTLPHCNVVFKPVLTTPEEILNLCAEANFDKTCAGIITWMHTFSPAKMWISGLNELKKPLLHLHTQFNCEIPWDTIDMDFMNLNQSAHGDREYGFIGARMRIPRKVVVGYYKDPEVSREIQVWMNAAIAFVEGKNIKVARFGDNMRQVAVTEGDKVEAQIKFGWSVDGYGVGDLVDYVSKVTNDEIENVLETYKKLYEFPSDPNTHDAIREQAKIEAGLKKFLDDGGYTAFTTTFEDLHGLKQLPGLAVQHLMHEGYGFGAEGDWKTAALVRTMKIMNTGLPEGTSFMEDYTYHLEQNNEMILGAHMLEVCPSVAAEKPRIEVHPLSIGGKADPARLVFKGRSGPAIAASLVDLGDRFRLIVNEVEAIEPTKDMPRLPVARVLWKPKPSLRDAAKAWILAGGAHHTSFSYSVTTEHMMDWAEMAGIEFVLINENTTDLYRFREQLRINDYVWRAR
ncbi:L-arabinose isomerase AraA [Thermoclostridium stercorarium subsp. stercorarium DSM 8532]|jgi:L-arabinose isomerase|uniref:L-arabinose isomerase n=3 Tax=Thermoclostridium stercorarium TaxID=1510 RepID=L7VKE3_THES1|nr:L-arabinose isomerase [Thermoclostridium stercorarium]AGC68605.1 L-arabinose isomerase AraA [Thermoclostridium stercorarium subsp. stercorarium DSM 8532]ANW98949.1 L-arabinose isomerase [Thermoclostridium stercorarium subsp. thermolacticum DSM 2910]ANX01478.1 L-arabinose isomerase [Thermoclostridium stercorarium subsp. leptospartum DSM 9219]UZQ84585.1 L-arabinose isomerase [Thermoclostridium stercorarium]